MGTTCSGPSTGLLSYELWPSEGTGAAFGEAVAIAKISPAATIGQVHWNPPAGKGPTLTKRPPTIDPANEGDEEFEDEGSEEPRKPTAPALGRASSASARRARRAHALGATTSSSIKPSLDAFAAAIARLPTHTCRVTARR